MSLLRNDFFNLSEVSKEALRLRLSNSDEYTANEIDTISKRSERLFPKDYELSEELTEDFRILAKFSKVELRPRELTSHRKIVGPIIVLVKRVLFKLMGAVLKDTLNAQEIFNRYTVKAMARASVKK